jgi:sulfatase maturation enzyme AslB (radical SAM superfamily)
MAIRDKFLELTEFLYIILKKILPKYIMDKIDPIKYKFRIKKWPTLILGSLFTTNHQLIEINITFDCNLKCLYCNRSCSQAPSEDYMSVEQIEKFIIASRKKNRK